MNSQHPPLLGHRIRKVVLGSTAMGLTTLLLMQVSWAQYRQSFRPEIYNYQGGKRRTGLRFGRLQLHGILGVRTQYDTNTFYSDANTQSDLVSAVVPGADLYFGSRKIDVQSGYRFTLREYIQQSAQDSMEHQANLDVDFRMTRRFSLKVEESFDKSSDPADAELPERVGRIVNEASGEFMFRTPAEDLDVAAKYTHTYQKYDAELAALSFFSNKVSVTSRVNVSSHFRFLPKSVASISVEYGKTSFNSDPSLIVTNTDSYAISTTAGLTSQIYRKMSLAADVGATVMRFDTGPDLMTVTGGLNGSFQLGRRLTLKAGYQRRAQISTFSNYYSDHRFHFDATWHFTRKLETQFRSVFDLLDFSQPNVTQSGAPRSDFVMRTLLRMSYTILEWCTASVEYHFDHRDSNATNPILGTQSADFMRHGITFAVDMYY